MSSAFERRFAAVGAPLGFRNNGESVEVWYHYRDSSGSSMCRAIAMVDLPSAAQELDAGDRNVIRGTASLKSTEFEKTDLLPGAIIEDTSGGTHTARRVTMTIRGSSYRIDAVGEPEGGMITVTVVQGLEQYSNPRELDPL